MHFKKLKLQGFKSFVDGTELDIAQGLTGVVGPNGCGKSNLVEGLRWVMGETSAKQMRGAGMDDIIFGGTNDRPQRNVAEVILSLDNTERKAPSQFNGAQELEISRRIERQKGSTYRVNGQEVRAKDVQILFADQATGARSTGLVSQGRIGAIINAKSTDRRLLLEEAAGITGLHSRRHEAELRLRAAESNLERLEDVLTTLGTQLSLLKKQSRQATRYRNISNDIRKTEASVLYQRWASASKEAIKQKELLQVATDEVTEQAAIVSKANIKRESLAEEVAPLRDVQVSAAAELHRLTLANSELDAEKARIQSAIDQWSTRRSQVNADLNREKELTKEAELALNSLNEELEKIKLIQKDEKQRIKESKESLNLASQRCLKDEKELSKLTEQIASSEAELASIDRQLKTLEERADQRRLQKIARGKELEELQLDKIDPELLKQVQNKVLQIESKLNRERKLLDKLEILRSETDSNRENSREFLTSKEQIHNRLKAELSALSDLVVSEKDDLGSWVPILNNIEVIPGYEAALGAALGDDLNASLDQSAPRYWSKPTTLINQPDLPEGALPLTGFVSESSHLNRRLSQIGVVENEEIGLKLARELKNGQRLVDREGNLWRWDGFVAKAESTMMTSRLKQRNRLIELKTHISEAEEAFYDAKSANETIIKAAVEALQKERLVRDNLRIIDNDLAVARSHYDKVSKTFNTKKINIDKIETSIVHINSEILEISEFISDVKSRKSQIGSVPALYNNIDICRNSLNNTRKAYQDAQNNYDSLVRVGEECKNRVSAISIDKESWKNRHLGAIERVKELTLRDAAAIKELNVLADYPEKLEKKRQTLLNALKNAEKVREAAADKVLISEKVLGESEKNLRFVEEKFVEARENKVRAQSAIDQAEQNLLVLRERINERLECDPTKLLEIAQIREGQPVPDLDSAVKRFDRLIRERDNMGPVNLRAQLETDELTEKISMIETEKNDLTTAISRLRQGISNLNKEARQRLVISFEEVNSHFKSLFERLFGGGSAKLSLTESDDPLHAGLEIYASPPGKKLQNLSLLSGGEQAMTAIALLFAVFLTNPAPICVLDEVDAALDDANVDRFCLLLSEIADAGDTRFLVITHHRMTMSRMDRLYGVTMPEQGISQLVSVDLRKAEQIRATA